MRRGEGGGEFPFRGILRNERKTTKTIISDAEKGGKETRSLGEGGGTTLHATLSSMQNREWEEKRAPSFTAKKKKKQQKPEPRGGGGGRKAVKE